MGYCYDQRGRLCCDLCGESGGVRKVPCPFGYCQPIAACPKCRQERKEVFSKKNHREHGCERGHAEHVLRETRTSDLLAAGKAVRCSALATDHGVHVLFRRQDGTCEGWYMDAETYHAFELLVPTTPDDYRQHGELRPAPSEFHFGSTTKQVVLT